MTDTELELPQGWITALLPDVVKNEKSAIKRGPFGSHLKKEFFVKSGYKVYEQQHAINNDFTLGRYYINEEKFQELKNFEVKEDDIIISCSGTIGKIAVAPKNIKKGIINQALLKISLNEDIMPREFFKYLFKFWMNKSEIESHGSGMGNLSSVKSLKKTPILLPPLNEQKRIVSKIEELFSKIDSAKLSLEHTKLQLEQYRASLLKSAFEGKEWKKIKIGDNLNFQYGKGLSKKDRKKGKIPVYGSSGITGYHNKALVETPSLIVGRKGSAGSVYLVDQSFWPIDTTYFIEETAIYNLKFLFHLLIHLRLGSIDSSTAIPSLRRDDVYGLEIPLPSIEEQEQIVSKIEQGFSLIENTTQIVNSVLQNLQTMKMSVFKQAFEGKLVPQDPNDEPASVLLEKIKLKN